VVGSLLNDGAGCPRPACGLQAAGRRAVVNWRAGAQHILCRMTGDALSLDLWRESDKNDESPRREPRAFLGEREDFAVRARALQLRKGYYHDLREDQGH
jgi:hypothetical protein